MIRLCYTPQQSLGPKSLGITVASIWHTNSVSEKSCLKVLKNDQLTRVSRLKAGKHPCHSQGRKVFRVIVSLKMAQVSDKIFMGFIRGLM